MDNTPFDRAEELIGASIDMTIGITRLVDYVKAVNACAKSLEALKEVSLAKPKQALALRSKPFVKALEQLAECKESALELITAYMESRNSAEPLRGELNTIVVGREDTVISSINRDEINLEQLRQFIDDASLQKAIRAAIRAGVKEIRGVKFEKKTSYHVR